MNYRTISLILLVFSIAVSGLYLLAVDTSKYLLATNAALMAQIEQSRQHPVHDAEITVWKEKSGDLLIVVNGQFGHPVKNPCGLPL